MKKVLFIAAGGCIGAILRYLISVASAGRFSTSMFGTLTINVTGSFILALILSETFKRLNSHPNIKLGAAAGLLGAFTTFSTLCREAAQLMYSGLYFSAVLYVFVSALLGIAAVYFGMLTSGSLTANSNKDAVITAEEYQENGDV